MQIDLKGLQGLYLQGLVGAHQRFKQNAELEKLITNQIISLLKSRQSNGLRSRSYETNFQVLKSINTALENYYSGQSKTTKCQISIGDKNRELESDKTCTALDIPFEKKEKLPIKWKCEGPAFLDLEVNYLLKDINKKKTELHNVENFGLTLPEKSEIGEKIALKANFKTLKEAQNLTVSFSIPADLKLRASKNP